ncbi:MAG: hypothetical protein ACEPOZ_21320 [Marinifilaceae bacterium]
MNLKAMYNYTQNSCPLTFFDVVIKDAITDFQELKKEHQYSESGPDSFSDYLHSKVIVETNLIVDHLKQYAHTISNESDLTFFIQKIQTHLKNQIFSLKRLSFDGADKIVGILEHLQFKIIQLFVLFKQSVEYNSPYLLPEIEVAHQLLQPEAIKTTLYDEFITVVCTLGTIESITSTFLPNFRSRYTKLCKEKQKVVLDRIQENFQTRKGEQFQLFLEANYNLLKSLSHPEIRDNLANCSHENEFHYTELFVRSQIQEHFLEPILAYLNENFPQPSESFSSDKPGDFGKITFNTSRIKLTLIFLLFQHLEILKDIANDYQLAKFIEENFLYEGGKPMRNIKTLISQIRSQEVNFLPALQEIFDEIQVFFKKIAS